MNLVWAGRFLSAKKFLPRNFVSVRGAADYGRNLTSFCQGPKSHPAERIRSVCEKNFLFEAGQMILVKNGGASLAEHHIGLGHLLEDTLPHSFKEGARISFQYAIPGCGQFFSILRYFCLIRKLCVIGHVHPLSSVDLPQNNVSDFP
jgi:hypothetical protein